jgi:tetratricopeptide (TPR) repeat protein
MKNKISLPSNLLEIRRPTPLLDRFKAHPPAGRFLLAASAQEVSIWDILDLSYHSFSLQPTDFGGMHHWAELATILADAVCAQNPHPEAQDVRGMTWHQKADSLRVLARFPEAEEALGVAAEALARGTRNPLLAARLWESRGALDRDWRRFRPAQDSFAQARVLYQEAGSEIGATCCLVVEAMAAAKNRNPVRGARLALAAMRRAGSSSHPHLTVSISHILAWCLVDQGRSREARAVYSTTEPLFDELRDEPLVQAHRHWLVAHIDGGLGIPGSADPLLRRAADAFAQAGLIYEETLVRLDLAAVLARQHRLAEVRSTVKKIQRLFEPLGIAPHAPVARRLRSAALPSQCGCLARALKWAARKILVQPMPRRSIPPVVD